MIIRPGSSPLYSPTDLIAFLEGDFVAWMERKYAEAAGGPPGPGSFVPDEDDAEDALVKRKGEEHEAGVLELLRARHGSCVEIARDDQAEARTLEAMREGAPLIYQAHLAAAPWHGYPDFLVRTDRPSLLGPWAYWPLDSKLARSAKPYFLIQLCAYADLLERAQGARPGTLGFVLGDRLEVNFDTERYFYFYRHLKERFDRFQAAFDSAGMPDPALEASFGRWDGAARSMLAERDDLRLVARISRSQVKRLRDAGVATMADLASETGARPRVAAEVLERLRRQARLQIASRGQPRPVYELIATPPGRTGLAGLPPASRGDVFLDLEGFPLADGGLEYLFGAVTDEGGQPRFHDWWAHESSTERAAFESAVDWLHARWRVHPAMHIYHYAGYEVTAFRHLMGKYATREREVDNLLRHERFVDLLSIVRQGVAIGTEGYSLKDIEVLFSPARHAGVVDAAGSMVEYQRWLDSGESGDWKSSPILAGIRDYNREDCESTWRLATWLRERQAEAGIDYVPAPRPEQLEEPEDRDATELLASQLLAAADTEVDPERARVGRLLGWLLNYHRREDKPMWWRYYDRLGASQEELFEDADCLGGLSRTDTPPSTVKRSRLVEYAFDPEQDTKLETGSKVYVLGGEQPFKTEIVALDADRGVLSLKFGPSRTVPDTCNLIPDEDFNSDPVRAAVYRFGERWYRGAIDGAQAVDDLLLRRPPRLTRARSDLLAPEPRLPADLIQLVRSLDGTTLCIQGPPGSGKTHNAAAVIASLAADGCRIGVASNSHKAIVNLLDAVAKARGGEQAFRILKAGRDEPAAELASRGIAACKPEQVAGHLASGAAVVGGTVWVWVRDELEGRLDYLFVDEAGQVSLANAVAMGLAARNIVLIGDQMQLAQPVQGTHPGESGASCLHYVLHGHATVPPDRGVFLPRTWRLHPDICRFVSDTAYDSRLRPEASTAGRAVIPPAGPSLLPRGVGILLEEVAHEGNTQSSPEEVERIVKLVADLKRSSVTDGGGRRPFDPISDLLIVAPYNAQVRRLRERLGGLRIASVDKFQGQEARVVIVSMCASSVEETPRGAGFLLDPNRLNVAISRAQSLAIVVASRDLVRTRPTTVAEMELLNLFCRLRYYALQSPRPGAQS